MPSASPNKPIPERWLILFRLIPGYDAAATAGDCWFDTRAADKAVKFFSAYMTHIEGEPAGKPFNLEPWQQAIVGCAFGWKRPDAKRRYREVFQFVPRKNGKSTLLGGLINLVAFCDDEPGAQIYSAAADREQAALVYRQAKGMILNQPELEAGTRIYATFKSIEYPGGVVYKALSADADNKHGFNTHFVVVDELHAQPNRDLVDVLVTSTGSRRQPLVWYITTSDFDRESICNEKYDYACKVRDNGGDPSKPGYDPSFLPVIYEATADDDWKSPETWRKANPNLGVSVSLEYLERECKRAQESPAYENTFKRLHLNLRTQNDVRWLSMERWDACEPFDPADLGGEECFAGIDLSTKLDLTCLSLYFPKFKALLPLYFIPEDNIRGRVRRDRVPYDVWVKQGLVFTTPGNVVDYQWISEKLKSLAAIYQIREVAYDPWNATQFALGLQADGFRVIEFRQGYRTFSEPTKELEKLVIGKELKHSGHKVLRWNAQNVSIDTDAAGNIKPSKEKSTERIDGIVASIMAIGVSLVAAPAQDLKIEFI